MPTKRKMLIVWKWFDFKKNQVNANFWSTEKSDDIFKSNNLGKDLIWNEYLVCSQTTRGIEFENPEAKIIRTDIINDHPNSKKYLAKLINYHEEENSKLFVFLHRGVNGFTPKEVTFVLNETKANKCFLIGDGRDFIYHNARNSGLLNDKDDFFDQPIEPSKPEIIVADRENKQVFQPHFDKVWFYYKNEFDIKIFELRDDLLLCLLPLIEEENINIREALMNENPLLMLRLKSFVSDNLAVLDPTEESILKDKERYYETSYIFDDFKKNLAKHKPETKKELKDVDELLHQVFFKEKETSFIPSVYQLMSKIQKEFSQLIDIMKTE